MMSRRVASMTRSYRFLIGRHFFSSSSTGCFSAAQYLRPFIINHITAGTAQNPSLRSLCTGVSLDPTPRKTIFSSSTSIRRYGSSSNTNSPISFNFPDSDEEDDQQKASFQNKTTKKEIDRTKLPPPYDPFSKKPVIQEPTDPKNLQEVFHNMRTEGLMSNAVKMFDALSKDGLTHEALQLFAEIKDQGHMPDVIAHTAVVEAYANAGQVKEAVKTYTRMLASGVNPNAYTYSVLIKGLASGGKLEDAKKYLMEMMDKGMRPNVGTFIKENQAHQGRQFLEQIKEKGFVPDEKGVREHLSKRGQVFRGVMGLLFGK